MVQSMNDHECRLMTEPISDHYNDKEFNAPIQGLLLKWAPFGQGKGQGRQLHFVNLS